MKRMERPCEIRFVDSKLKKAFKSLENSTDDEKRLYSWLNRAFEDIEKNAFCGIEIQKSLIPKQYDKLGIKYTTIKQGKYKDAGSTDRELTEEEKALLEEQTRKIYEIFIADVAAGRKMDIAKVREIATGWVYLGEEAKKLGLIDEIGTYSDAVKEAARMGKIEGEPVIIKGGTQSFYDILSGYMGAFSSLKEILALKDLLRSGSIQNGSVVVK